MSKVLIALLFVFSSLAQAYSLREDGVRGSIWTNNGDGNFLTSYPMIGLSSIGWVPLSLNPDGTIGISATFSGAVDQGLPGTLPWLVTSALLTVSSSTITNVSVTANLSQSLLNSNSNRKGVIIFDQSATNCYVAMNATSSPTAFSFIMVPFQNYNMDQPIYQGAVSAYCTSNGNLQVTEF